MRLLLAIFVAGLLVGCGRDRTLPPTYASPPNQTLEAVCDEMRQFTLEVGYGRLSRKERRALRQSKENLTMRPTTLILRQDMGKVLETMYLLPIENYEDVNAFAHLVYNNCMLTNQ